MNDNQTRHNRHTIDEFLSEIVYGGIDGCVTTFAVVAGAVGAGLSSTIIIILGFANLFADGLSMSFGAYLSARSRQDTFHKHKKAEYGEVETVPESEREEIREIFRSKGFKGELLEQAVSVITSDKDRWVDVMMKEELNMMEEHRSPYMIGLATYVSFLIVGLVPLTIYVVDALYTVQGDLFTWSCLLTGFGFLLIGALKSHVTRTSFTRGILETLLLGAIAAVVAYYIGDFLEHLMAR